MSTRLVIDETKRQIIVNGLHTAARTYEDCAKTMKEQSGQEFQRLAEQFLAQAAEVRNLADEIEAADVIAYDEEKHHPDCPAIDGFGCRCGELG